MSFTLTPDFLGASVCCSLFAAHFKLGISIWFSLIPDSPMEQLHKRSFPLSHSVLPLWVLRSNSVSQAQMRCDPDVTPFSWSAEPSLGLRCFKRGSCSSELRNEWFYQILEDPYSAIP